MSHLYITFIWARIIGSFNKSAPDGLSSGFFCKVLKVIILMIFKSNAIYALFHNFVQVSRIKINNTWRFFFNNCIKNFKNLIANKRMLKSTYFIQNTSDSPIILLFKKFCMSIDFLIYHISVLELYGSFFTTSGDI